MSEVPVVICGAGPVGLTMSILLSRMGIPTLLVERRESVSTLPRARGIMSRTVEIWSHFGLYPEMTEFSLPPSWCQEFLYLDTLAGELIGAMPSNCMAPDAQQETTAYEFRCAAQDQIDSMLWRCAAAYPLAEIRFSTELVEHSQDDDGVTVTLQQADGSQELVRTSWLVGADGGRSPLREASGITSTGPTALGSFVNKTSAGGQPAVRPRCCGPLPTATSDASSRLTANSGGCVRSCSTRGSTLRRAGPASASSAGCAT